MRSSDPTRIGTLAVLVRLAVQRVAGGQQPRPFSIIARRNGWRVRVWTRDGYRPQQLGRWSSPPEVKLSPMGPGSLGRWPYALGLNVQVGVYRLALRSQEHRSGVLLSWRIRTASGASGSSGIYLLTWMALRVLMRRHGPVRGRWVESPGLLLATAFRWLQLYVAPDDLHPSVQELASPLLSGLGRAFLWNVWPETVVSFALVADDES